MAKLVPAIPPNTPMRMRETKETSPVTAMVVDPGVVVAGETATAVDKAFPQTRVHRAVLVPQLGRMTKPRQQLRVPVEALLVLHQNRHPQSPGHGKTHLPKPKGIIDPRNHANRTVDQQLTVAEVEMPADPVQSVAGGVATPAVVDIEKVALISVANLLGHASSNFKAPKWRLGMKRRLAVSWCLVWQRPCVTTVRSHSIESTSP